MEYCLIERRNKIDSAWELVAKLVCSDTQEADILLDSYAQKCFDICEYRWRSCTPQEFYQAFVVSLTSPSLRGLL